jgi:hypothetical protein
MGGVIDGGEGAGCNVLVRSRRRKPAVFREVKEEMLYEADCTGAPFMFPNSVAVFEQWLPLLEVGLKSNFELCHSCQRQKIFTVD